MAITDKKVSESYSGRDISSLSDRPNQDGMTASQLKSRFDQLGKEVIPKHNDLIDELNADLYGSVTNNTHKHNLDNQVEGSTNKFFTASEKTKLGGIATGAEVNQNAYSHTVIDGVRVLSSESKTDDIKFKSGDNIVLTYNTSTKEIILNARGKLSQEVIDVLSINFSNGSVMSIDAVKQIAQISYPDGTTHQISSELWYAEGKAQGNIVEGDNVMLAGSQGEHYLVKKAVASELATNPQLYLGVATKNSLNNEWAKITRWGLVNGINTSAWAYGTKLYFNPVTLGFTSTLPSLPNARIEVGMVVKQHATAGIILVLPFALNLYTNAEIDALFNAKAPKDNPIFTGIIDNQGGRIKFPATQVPSADPNTLDDYEEGTFTPTVTTSGGTISSVILSGKYIKIGKKVTVICDINIITLGSANGSLLVTLPFVSEYVSCGVGRDVTITGNVCFVTLGQNYNIAEIKKYDSNSILTADGVRIWFELTYFAST